MRTKAGTILASAGLALCAALASFAQDSGQSAPPKPTAPPPPGGRRPVTPGQSPDAQAGTIKYAGPRSAIQRPRFVLVRNQKALNDLLKEHNPNGGVHEVQIDFKKSDVIAYFVGSKPTGGYSVELAGIDRGKEGATVRIRVLKPGKGSMVTQAFTSPFLIQSVEKLPAKVSHTVTEQERGG